MIEKVMPTVLHQIKVMILVVIVVFTVSVVLSIIVANQVSNNFGMFVLILGVCLCIFIWGIYGTPLVNYYNYLKDMYEGRSRTIKGTIKKIGNTPVYKDNKLYFYEVLIDDEGEERLLYNDANSPVEGIEENQNYLFVIHENFIKSVQI